MPGNKSRLAVTTKSEQLQQFAAPTPTVSMPADRLLDMLPIAGYVCDREGRIVRFNPAAASLWGQTQVAPEQLFCGSYRLYSPDGKALAHAECPVAIALRTGQPVRNRPIVIERPDGSRVLASSNVEVLRDHANDIVGAVNWLRQLAPASDDELITVPFEKQFLDRGVAGPGEFANGLGRGRHVASLRYFQELLMTLPAAVYTTDAEGRITFYNDSAVQLWGIQPKLGESEFCGSWKLYWPDGTPLPHGECPMAKALKEQRPNRGMEAVAERPDGSRVPFMPYPSPLFDEYGLLIGAVNMLIDLSELKRAEEADARLAAIVESTEDAIVSKTLEGKITSWNRGATELFGYSAEDAVGQSIMMLIPDDRADEETMILDRIQRGKRVGTYETVRRCKDGTLINVLLTVSPMRDSTGRIIGASKIARDISGRKRLEEQRELMLREMNHRIKNLFALATSMVEVSRKSAASAEELAEAVKGRLFALAQAHELTLPARCEQMDQRPTTLKALLNAVVTPHVVQGTICERVGFEGPNPPIAGQAVSSLALLLHELATNAAKYGALAVPSGRISVRCVEQGVQLLVSWTEEGGPAVVGPPATTGFGTMLAKATVRSQFDGEIAYEWNPSGMTVNVTLLRHRLTQ